MMRVLIVDDEPIVLKQLTFLIEKLYPKWEVVSCTDSIQAQKILAKENFQLAILDIELPGKNGLHLAHYIRHHYEHVNIMMISAYQDFDYAKTSIEIGVDYYLTKPIIESELKKALSKYKSYTQYSNIVMEAINYIQKNYANKITLQDISDHIYVNSSYLSRRFREETGKRLFDFILDYRLKMAKVKLRKNQTKNISSIANSCGFNSLHYFSSTFKKKIGVTPMEYRKGALTVDDADNE